VGEQHVVFRQIARDDLANPAAAESQDGKGGAAPEIEWPMRIPIDSLVKSSTIVSVFNFRFVVSQSCTKSIDQAWSGAVGTGRATRGSRVSFFRFRRLIWSLSSM
jgi:hypothetical protein